MGFVPTKKIYLGGPTLAHCTT